MKNEPPQPTPQKKNEHKKNTYENDEKELFAFCQLLRFVFFQIFPQRAISKTKKNVLFVRKLSFILLTHHI